MRKLFYILFSIAALVAAMSFIAPKQPTLTINFENYVGNQLLKLDSVTYKNEMGQSFTVSKFKYYISNITLTNWEGFSCKIDSSFLVNEEEPLSK
ncbi:MAG TPA: MbnP family protein, partial [Bacteroidia bacterium]|nr:MbnP family protein [Bacteroidia bacterium]